MGGGGGRGRAKSYDNKKRSNLIVLHSCSMRKGLEAKLRPILYSMEKLTEDETNKNVVINYQNWKQRKSSGDLEL